MRAEVKVSDNGYRELLENAAAARARTTVRAGIFAGPPRQPEAHEEGESSEPLTNAEVGAVHEFGLGHNKERSFIRATVDENREEINTHLRNIGVGFFKPRATVQHEAALFGEWFVGKVKARIVAGIDPPLEDETIKRKGSSTPLIDSSQLLGSITYDVKQGGR